MRERKKKNHEVEIEGGWDGRCDTEGERRSEEIK